MENVVLTIHLLLALALIALVLLQRSEGGGLGLGGGGGGALPFLGGGGVIPSFLQTSGQFVIFVCNCLCYFLIDPGGWGWCVRHDSRPPR